MKAPGIILIMIAAMLCASRLCIGAQDTVLLFSYFKDDPAWSGQGFNPGDGVHLAWSSDGLNWTALNNDAPVFRTRNNASIRDPQIMRGPDGVFHLVWTANANGTMGVGYASSTNLMDWSGETLIPVMAHEPDARNVWAPEIFFDDINGEYMIFWATTIPGRFPKTDAMGDGGLNHRMYYVTTKDFQSFSGTKLLYDPGFNCIDASIYKVNDGKYLMFIKNETLMPPQKNIVMARARAPQGPWGKASAPITPRGVWAEGPAAVFFNGRWLVYFDMYMQHGYGLVASADLKTWEILTPQLNMPEGIRHGTVFEVPRSALQALISPH
jgi:GH43 family beta-xylosidase